MATATKPKPTKVVNRESKTKLDSLVKMPSQESLLVNVLNNIQNDIRELRTNIKWTLGIMASLIAFVFMVMFFLHNDLKSAVKQNSESIHKINESINQINQKLDKLLNK